jgi:hypothetical protein
MNLQKRQIAKFHMPLADENHKQLYVVLQLIEEDGRPTEDIQALNFGLFVIPANKQFV